jgi:molybdenum cofactor biosynthesis enzyme MoaA
MTVALSATQMLRLLSLVGNTTQELLHNLAANTKVLTMELSQYNRISASINTKFLYELYPTSFHDGFELVGVLIALRHDSELTKIQIVPKSSAVVPGTRNTEAVGLNKTHIDMVKFDSAEDDDFSTVALLIQGMSLENKLGDRRNIGDLKDLHISFCSFAFYYR